MGRSEAMAFAMWYSSCPEGRRPYRGMSSCRPAFWRRRTGVRGRRTCNEALTGEPVWERGPDESTERALGGSDSLSFVSVSQCDDIGQHSKGGVRCVKEDRRPRLTAIRWVLQNVLGTGVAGCG
eukprot:1382263-Pleurochrysis_carterae.AAC.2